MDPILAKVLPEQTLKGNNRSEEQIPAGRRSPSREDMPSDMFGDSANNSLNSSCGMSISSPPAETSWSEPSHSSPLSRDPVSVLPRPLSFMLLAGPPSATLHPTPRT